MKNAFCKKQLFECSKELSAVAMGNIPAETVIKNAKLINVCTKEIQEFTDVAVHSGRIALVGDASHCIGKDTKVIDANGRYLAPGLLDGHIHIESSMLSATEYARCVISHGTTGIFHDPHEICNVLGMKGVDIMVEDAKKSPLKAMLTTPSCVPAVEGFEDTGAIITAEDIKEDMKRAETVGLGEMMNFPGVINSLDSVHAITNETLKADKIITGHYSLPETGKGLNAYIASGIRCCHESTRAEDALAKMRLGMYAMFREGSAWHDLHALSKAITENPHIDTRYAVLISDDTHPHTLLSDGHLDHLLRRAVEEGIDPLTAIQMLTINCAQCFKLDNELGSIAPSKCADMILFDNLKDFNVSLVLIDGDIVAENGEVTYTTKKGEYPDFALNTIQLGEEITSDTFKIPTDKESLEIRVIEIIPAGVPNYERHIKVKSVNGFIESDINQDVIKAFVFDRHKKSGTHGVGFIKGFKLKSGAVASTVAHDAHNLFVAGTNDDDMALAAKTLIESGGGLVACENGKILGHVPLPLAGLMNPFESAENLSALIEGLSSAFVTLGCDIVSPFMTMALIPLACLPELRLTNRGLVDCTKFEFVPLEV